MEPGESRVKDCLEDNLVEDGFSKARCLRCATLCTLCCSACSSPHISALLPQQGAGRLRAWRLPMTMTVPYLLAASWAPAAGVLR